MVIQDDRTTKDFSKITFSGYRKPDVVKAFEKCIISGNVERACFWTAEMVCSGKAAEVWERLICVYCQHGFRESPKGALLLADFTKKFRRIVNSGQVSSELELRNHTHARKLLGMATAAIAAFKKGLPVKRIKVQCTDLDLSQIPQRLQATSTKHAIGYQDRDPKELFIAVNELCYAINSQNDAALACYWVEWIISYTSLCKKRKSPLQCATRAEISGGVRAEDPAWLIWDVILHSDLTAQTKRIVESLLTLFRLRYQPGTLSKRVHVIYSAIEACNPSFGLGPSLSSINSAIELGNSCANDMYDVVSAGAPDTYDSVTSITSSEEPIPKNVVSTLSNIDLLLSTAPFGPGK